jgi:hypothetical protein
MKTAAMTTGSNIQRNQKITFSRFDLALTAARFSRML